jgi:hypothetical protein
VNGTRNATNDKAQFAWQPLTARGVAAFASATVGRLLLVQFIIALLVAGLVVWFVHKAWFPTISEAIRNLPSEGAIRSGRLEWPGPSPKCLAEGRFLALVVDLDHTGEARSPAQVQVEFGRQDFKVYSLFGYLRGAYPRRGAVAFNQTELEPWWGAWAPPILAIVAGLVVAGLMMLWACLATLYCLPVWLVGLFADRDCSLGGSWRLAGAALMPGALLMCAAILTYGWGALDLVRLTLAGAVHLVVGWVYVVVSPLCLPRHPEATANINPFV